MDYRLDRRLLVSAWLLAAIVVAGVMLSFWNTTRMRDDARWVAHTQATLKLTAKWLRTGVDAETWARKFILTGDADFVSLYEHARAGLDDQMAELMDATKDNPDQQARLAPLRDAATALVARLDEGIEIRRRDPTRAQSFLIDKQNMGRMNAARQALDEFQEEERRLLTVREHEAERSYKMAVGLTLVNVAAGLAGIAGFVWMIRRSMAARLQSATALQQSVDALGKSNAELEQFAYVASHDLQEPLRAVSGCVQILQKRYRGKLDESADELIRHAVDGAARMQALIRDLLAYSRVTTRVKEFEPVDATTVVKLALTNLEVAVKESRAVVTHDALPVVKADVLQLTQVFQNLFSNAIKFTNADVPRIHVSARRDEGSWRFAVQDQGIGIAREYAERIFVIFQRLHTREEFPGTGIGLAICRKVIERHGGRMWVDSAPGKGATFHFTIPDA